MEIEQKINRAEPLLSDQARKQIHDFLIAKKRRTIIYTLAENGAMTQGELAAAIQSTVTSLCNIIKAFEKLDYPLFEVERVGKYRRYKLSALGWDYVNGAPTSHVRKPAGGILDITDQRILEDAEKSLNMFKERNVDGDWQKKLDEALRRRVSSGELLDNESEQFVDQYLRCIELLSIYDKQEAFAQALDLLTNDIHRSRIEDFMDRFEPFVPVLRYFKDGEDAFTMCMLLQFAFAMREEAAAQTYITAVGWKGNEYARLKKVIPGLVSYIRGFSEKDIAQYLGKLLPDEGLLCSYLAKILYDAENARHLASV